MNLHEVQSFAATQIMAVPALAALGQPVLYSLFDDDQEIMDRIGAQRRATGVCIDIGQVAGDDARNASTPGRGIVLDASFEVFIGEEPKVPHTPSDLDLVRRVVAALCRQPGNHDVAPRCTGYDAAKDDHGVILHVLSFTVPVRIT
jgi:hypothetical protein